MKQLSKLTGPSSVILAAFAFFLAPQEAESQHIFWSELDRGEVWTADWSGNNAQAIVTGLTRPIGLGLDQAGNRIYIAQDGAEGAGAISWAPIGGGTATDIVTGRSNPQMLSLDTVGGHVYWTEYTGQVMRSDLSGGGVQTIMDDAARYTPLGLDRANQRLYASDPALGPELWISDFDGSNKIQSPDSPFGNWSTNAMEIFGDLMYYSHGSEIRVSPLDDLTSFTTLADGIGLPLGLAVAPNDLIYWGARNDQAIGVVGLDGTGANTTFMDLTGIVGGDSNPFGVAVIPEPSTYAFMFALGAGMLVLLRRRLRND